MSVASEKTPIAAAVTLQHGPETLALGGPLKALAGFFVSGFLLAFLGAILPSWGHHLQADYWMIGLYFVALILGLLISVGSARPLMERCYIWRFSRHPMQRGGGCRAS
jgi:hypothetical protein